MPKGILWAVLTAPIFPPIGGTHPEGNRHHPNGEPHHITLQYGVERQDWQWFEGMEFSAEIYELCWDERIQAALVRLPNGLPCQNSKPHITISWADGVPPNDANRMIQDMHFAQPLRQPERVQCQIQFLEWATPPPNSNPSADRSAGV